MYYHYLNQEPYHNNSYTNVEVAKPQNVVDTISQVEYHPVIPNIKLENLHPTTIEDPRSQPEEVNDEKNSATKVAESKVGVKKVKPSVETPNQSTVDTSNFSIEERLVAAVWVHERKLTGDSINEIKYNFKRRFDRDPPSKTTLFAWERKLFSTGNVCDAPRTGRPVHRKQLTSRVAASVSAAPALSLRARARALGLPRSTLHNILRYDLPHESASKPTNHTHPKRPESRRVRRQALRGAAAPAAPPAPLGPFPRGSASLGPAPAPPLHKLEQPWL